jgi:signal transduction histidine kinase
MARLEAGRMKPQRDTFAFADLVKEISAVCKERERAGAAALVIDIATGFPNPICTDRARLRQILINLLSNALDYTASDGAVTLSGRRLPTGDVEIRVVDTGRACRPPS